eukprot:TRINITY_DN3694_c0_g1_i2.p1 TRINITY_DN3694_c0_g1~~TRINITY_DN3694_c0_g1_i2.p1  ORF type:complete len:576 (-),score=106.85 TRINITY_DN3694_c0_g1_i2:162-1889(-)
MTFEPWEFQRRGMSNGDNGLMEADTPCNNGSMVQPPNFSFAFNDSNFSDRVLRIEVMAGPLESKSDEEGCSSIADWAMKNRKRRREDVKKDKALDVGDLNGEQTVLNQQLNADDLAAFENADEEAVAMIEESPTSATMISSSPGMDDGLNGQSSWSMDCSTVLKVRTIHISSAILAAKSPFFYKLFSNGMRESEQRDVTLRINASEEAAVMDLLNFMYSGMVSANTAPALLDVLMAADKFEVASCMRHCSRMLRNLPMTPESALLYLELPSSVLMANAVQPLTDAAKQFLAKRYKDITKHHEEVMSLPLPGIEAVLSSDELQVASEDAVYDFVLKWARMHYPKIEERREILGSRLGRLIRFPNMSSRKLKKVLNCHDFDHDLASKVVLDALFFKAEPPHKQRALASEDTSHSRFTERAYRYRPVKVVEFDKPYQQCIVFMDLKKEECEALYPSGRVYSQAFHLGGQGFFLSAHCNMDQQNAFHCFGLFLGMQEKGSVSFSVDYEFAVRQKPSFDFVVKYKGNYLFTGGKAVGYRNLFQTPWSSFMAEECPYFDKNILHLRAELTIRPQPQLQQDI